MCIYAITKIVCPGLAHVPAYKVVLHDTFIMMRLENISLLHACNVSCYHQHDQIVANRNPLSRIEYGAPLETKKHCLELCRAMTMRAGDA
jgi:hypothetical protein